jgi:hypothetical protein
VVTTVIEMRCSRCGQARTLLDEHDRCEQCVMGLTHIVAQTLEDLENIVATWRDRGLTGAQLHEVVAMMLTDRAGTAASSPFRRDPVDTSEGAIWFLEPPSLFDDDDARPNRIGRLRQASGVSREALAERLDVPVTDLALWEAGTVPPDDALVRLAGWFGVREAFLVEP